MTNFSFLKKGTLVELIQPDPGVDYVHVTQHKDPRMAKFIFNFHEKIVPLSCVTKFASDNNINMHMQMGSKQFKSGTIGLVLASFANIDDITQVETINTAKTNPFFSGFCLLIGDGWYVVPGRVVRKLRNQNTLGMEQNTIPSLEVQK